MTESRGDLFGDDELLPIFLQEAQEQLETLDQGLVRLEKEPDNTPLIQGIFRAAHTLKGSSGAMGLKEIAELTHRMEDVFDRIRNQQLTLTPEIMDQLLRALDLLHVLVGGIERGASAPSPREEIDAVTRELVGVVEGHAQAASGAQAASAKIGVMPDSNVVLLIQFAGDCQMPALRAYMVLHALEPIGEIQSCQPSMEAIEQEHIENRLLIVLETPQDADAIRQHVMNVGEIEWVRASRGVAAAGMFLTMPSREQIREEHVDARADEQGHAGLQQTVRVNVETLDEIMNIVGEMVLDRTRIAGLVEELRGATLDHEIGEELETASQHLGTMVGELHEQVLETRMLPVSQLFNRFARLVRDLTRQLKKEVNFVISGESERLDRSVIEKLVDPLTHILRNALDHGMELPAERIARQKPPQGTVELSAHRAENYVFIEITDDGPGIDAERVKAKALEQQVITPEQAAVMSRKETLNLIFASGLSTAAKVSDVSGRGVGMDVVKRNIESLGGTIDITSELGQGTMITLKIPLTLAIVRALIVRVGRVAMAIPLTFVEETIKVHQQAIQTVRGSGLLQWRDHVVPVVRLSEVFPGCGSVPSEMLHLITVCYNAQPVCLVVDSIIGHQEIVVKTLGGYLGNIPGLGGATILGNGRVALIIDIGCLFEQQLFAQQVNLPESIGREYALTPA